MYPQLQFHGATTGVTGSCHELRYADDASLLIDCGLFQGSEKGSREIDFPIDHVKALVVTHVHIDHVGRIPYLSAAGFNGPIYCSEASAVLLPLVLEDAVKIGFSRNRGLIERFLKYIQQLIVPLPYHRWRSVTDDPGSAKIKLKPAGHILGSAYVECAVNGERIVFPVIWELPTHPYCRVLAHRIVLTGWFLKAPTETGSIRGGGNAGQGCERLFIRLYPIAALF